jgi:hypothetical protein
MLRTSICYLVMNHYKSNVILATPITSLDAVCICNAYKLNFDKLKQKGYKPRLNVMDNQATKHIKQLLPKKSANCSWWDHIITGSMLQNVPSKHSKMR